MIFTHSSSFWKFPRSQTFLSICLPLFPGDQIEGKSGGSVAAMYSSLGMRVSWMQELLETGSVLEHSLGIIGP